MLRTQITILGNLGADPKSRTAGESEVCSFGVGVGRKVKGEDITDWFNVSAWGKQGALCQEYLSKGSQVIVHGTFEPRTYEKDGEKRVSFDVRANEVHFLSKAALPSSEPSLKPTEDIPF